MRANRDGGGMTETAVDAGRLVVRTRPVPDRPVRTVLREAPLPRAVWAGPGEATVATAGAAAVLTASGPARFRQIRSAARDLFATIDTETAEASLPDAIGPRLVGGGSFHPDHASMAPWTDYPAARFVLPELLYARTTNGSYLLSMAYGPDAEPQAVEARLDTAARRLERNDPTPTRTLPTVTAIDRPTTRSAWTDQVERALSRIQNGTLRKVVLAQALHAELTDRLDPVAVLERLSDRYPDCYRFSIEPTDETAFFGATPERLVSLTGREVRTEALAGSIGRGTSPDEDATLEEALRDSGKDQHEHALVVEAIRDQLAPYAERIDTGEQGVRRLASVQHLHTPITADLAADEHILSLVDALHPTPAVGGLPPAEAQSTIREIETFDRGWYAAPVGWFDADGEGTFAVSLRSALTTDRRATLFAGAGIVADSAPDDEWDEVQLKYRPILDALDA